MMNEENKQWASVPGFAGLYEVSTLGDVRSLKRKYRANFGIRNSGGMSLKVFAASTGYAAVNMTKPGGGRKQLLVHRAVLEAFIGKPGEGMEACHQDGDRMNPSLLNLRWDTRKSNHADKLLHGTAQRGEAHGNAKFTDAQILSVRSRGLKPKQIMEELGCASSTAKRISNGSSWAHING